MIKATMNLSNSISVKQGSSDVLNLTMSGVYNLKEYKTFIDTLTPQASREYSAGTLDAIDFLYIESDTDLDLYLETDLDSRIQIKKDVEQGENRKAVFMGSFDGITTLFLHNETAETTANIRIIMGSHGTI